MWRASFLALAALAGCHIAFPIEPYDGDAALGTPPRVFSSPGPAWVMYGGYPKSFSITLAADLPGTVIYYTTDGSMPDPASATTTSSATPIGGITISATTTVKYFGDHNGARSQVASETFAIDMTTATANAGFLVTNVTLDTTSPVVIASPGSTLTARANVQTWIQPGCGGCSAQVVYGVDEAMQGCVTDGQPPVFPGTTTNGKTFNVKVPAAPGVHEVRVAHIEELTCADAMARNALMIRPNKVRIGVVIVR